VVATNSALTHYNMIGFGSAQVMGENPDFALMFVAPMDAEGVKLISRASYEMVAGATGSRTTTRSPAASTRTTPFW
jgi:4-hydroxyphenylacetate 3-monooxygenase